MTVNSDLNFCLVFAGVITYFNYENLILAVITFAVSFVLLVVTLK